MIGIGSKAQRQLGIAIAAAVGVILGATGIHGGLRVYSFAGSLVGGVYLVYERIAWRWGPVRRLTEVPLLDGTWSGELASTWKDPATDEGIPPKRTFIVVRQSGGDIHVRMLTDEMRSESDQAELSKSPAGDWTLRWTYRSDPKPSHLSHSAPHRGTGELHLPQASGERLLGSYYTERKTTGELTFDRHIQRYISDFSAAEDAFRAL